PAGRDAGDLLRHGDHVPLRRELGRGGRRGRPDPLGARPLRVLLPRRRPDPGGTRPRGRDRRRPPLPRPHAARVRRAHARPAAAADGLVEWLPGVPGAAVFRTLLAGEVAPAELVARYPAVGPVTDDRPTNEYFLLRSLGLAP